MEWSEIMTVVLTVAIPVIGWFVKILFGYIRTVKDNADKQITEFNIRKCNKNI